MTHRAAVLAALLLASTPAMAVTDPVPGPKDSRVRSVAYDPLQVIRLYSTGLIPLQLLLESGEKPMTVAGAMVSLKPDDAKDWLARPSGSVLFLQPMRQMEGSMLFVRAVAADGKDRYYTFELHTREASETSTAYMTVAFRYPPPPPTPEAAAAWRARRDQAAAARAEVAASTRLASTRALAPRNFEYEKRPAQSCADLAPALTFDDGVRTTMLFPPRSVLPQVYAVGSDGKWGIVTTVNETTPNGLEVVVPSIPKEMRLSRGGKVCALRIKAPDPAGAEPAGAMRQARSP